ncbi:MAG: FAD-dependent oxidoreductase [Alteromonas macleodii]|mgnify:FL=1|uniref:FAD-dependent oxidoreductase n=1 Tax=Alteromonas TaxID=226 RepID=UPI000C60A1C5|nr:bifunctional TVP38/TMEM64 family protein/FAD-dependent oxidoreductase [Alteromonas macleodii]MAW04647.1 pyridine nucleotide-disulfide oxidoreductase [Alteromonas sp.]MDM7961100.1 FAD-dependent oxidoreductase [Alteromonas macleodii]MDM8169926.1 FAD-dependent oxidoreductase [Alteromonas macleodii]CAI3952810.1 pyruvate/2-oxoglutarate dehydrogenase complex dihydrolipoamide dehydrogenase (E3) component [Alteromonas macleodii]VTP54802.1 pyruvate/2-oxoglutarate dehydrogenase complex dihydrolipoami|tara:strand:- start:292 stop:2445 length:2154 start_codon:yes stop_codon:yes gene_type:complete
MFKKIALLGVIVAAIFSFFYFDLNSYLTLQGMKDSLDTFQSQIAQNPVLSIGVFFAIYVAVTALSLPGAAILTLAAGALFGLVQGLVIVSFASSVGATLAFLVSRFILRDTVRNKFKEKLKKIDEGVEKQGAFYLFTLRLVPVFPFFLINLLMGLTSLKTWTFYWVSQVGMLAGTAVYVNAGTQLAQIDSLSGIVSPGLIFSFVLLGIFPWIAKAIVAVVNRRRVYKGYSKPKKFDRNLVVIGAGAGGLVTSYIAAAVKAKVTLVEAGEMGGDCLNYGCVPSKAIIKTAKVANQMRHADNYGLEPVTPAMSFKRVMARVHEVIAAIAPNDSVERYTSLGVDVVKGYAKIIDPWTVEIKKNDGGTQTLTTKNIVVATGAAPFIPELPGIEQSGYVTSDTLWTKFAELEDAPKRLIVLGGGPIGCELAQAFSRLGSDVTQVERAPRLMGREDADVAGYAESVLRESGVNVLTSHDALRFEQQDGEKVLVVAKEGVESTIAYDEVIVAVGRKARLHGFGLEDLGIQFDRTIETDEYLQTLMPNIFAAGDVVGPYQFTHVAAHQAWYAAVNALFGTFKKFKVDYRVIPWTTFIDPEVARVGINERDAAEQDIDVEVTRYEFAELDRAVAESARKGFIKVLTPPGKDKILGVTIVSEHAGDLLAEFVIAMKHDLGLNKILGTIHAYPTWAEGAKYAAGNWKRANAPEKLLSYVEKFHTWRRG